MLKPAACLAAISLTACASLPSGSPVDEEAIDGDPAAYPAFEAAAHTCSFQGLRKVTDGRGGSHFLIAYARPLSVETLCLFDWLDSEAGRRLYRSGH